MKEGVRPTRQNPRRNRAVCRSGCGIRHTVQVDRYHAMVLPPAKTLFPLLTLVLSRQKVDLVRRLDPLDLR